MDLTGSGSLPPPAVAYQRWLDSLGGAGWPARSGQPARPGVPGALGDVEQVAVDEALGRVTAAAVTARWPSPRCDCAAMDGIAVRAAGLAAAGAGAEGRDAAAGAIRLPAGAFEWIDTGDPMPAGLDTVVVRERLLPQADGGVLIVAGPGGAPGFAPSLHVRTAGEDFAAGEELLPAGRLLRPGDLAAAAAAGHVTLAVARRPVVAIIPTGDEIRPVGEPLRRGDIIDTNSVMLAARCRQLGALPQLGMIVPDDPDALAAELRRAAAGADLVLVIAGSSRGRGDHAVAVLAQVGGVATAGVAVRPGHPAILGHVKRPAAALAADRAAIVPAIGLPGYPLATAVIFELFAVPLLGALTGQAPARTTILARLDRDWTCRPETENWVLVTLGGAADGGALPLATPTRRGAGTISQLARADAWWQIPAGRAEFAAGTEIAVLPVAGPL
ncbi:MAG TPA: molybdopterin molybdotransferase MoeA [Trebonia sp.]|nr:molybdopterin molybdotransferase MoeA [Trebonia sp.]